MWHGNRNSDREHGPNVIDEDNELFSRCRFSNSNPVGRKRLWNKSSNESFKDEPSPICVGNNTSQQKQRIMANAKAEQSNMLATLRNTNNAPTPVRLMMPIQASATMSDSSETCPSAPSTSSSKRINASTRAYRTRRSAYKFLSRLGHLDPNSLSEKERDSLAWAKLNTDVRPGHFQEATPQKLQQNYMANAKAETERLVRQLPGNKMPPASYDVSNVSPAHNFSRALINTASMPIRSTGTIQASATVPASVATELSRVPETSGTMSASATMSDSSEMCPSAPSTSSSKRINASTRAYRTKRSALKILARLGNLDPKSLSEKDRESLSWAKLNINVRPVTPPETVMKRQLSAETVGFVSHDTKRPKLAAPKPKPNRPFNEVAKDDIVWAIIDRSNSDGTISPANWKLVQKAILNIYCEIVEANPGPAPSSRDAGWYQGHIKLIACRDQRSADLYKQAIERLGEIWSGAKLAAVSMDQVPKRPRSKAWIPAEPSSPDKILKLLQLSNDKLPTHDWKVVKISERKGNLREALIILNEESLGPLKACKGEVNYGFGSICLKVYKNDMLDSKVKLVAKPMTDALANTEISPLSEEDNFAHGGFGGMNLNTYGSVESPLFDEEDRDEQ